VIWNGGRVVQHSAFVVTPIPHRGSRAADAWPPRQHLDTSGELMSPADRFARPADAHALAAPDATAAAESTPATRRRRRYWRGSRHAARRAARAAAAAVR
jgi:hypothetical protein